MEPDHNRSCTRRNCCSKTESEPSGLAEAVGEVLCNFSYLTMFKKISLNQVKHAQREGLEAGGPREGLRLDPIGGSRDLQRMLQPGMRDKGLLKKCNQITTGRVFFTIVVQNLPQNPSGPRRHKRTFVAAVGEVL